VTQSAAAAAVRGLWHYISVGPFPFLRFGEGCEFLLINCTGRSATGESWQEIMMACSDRASVWCDAASDAAGQHCGSHVAYPFFISFYILCSFLVSRIHISFIFTYCNLGKTVKFVRDRI